MSQELVEVKQGTPMEVLLKVDKDGFTTAKNLYEFLELDASHYARWCKINILDNPFAEAGKDYSPLKASEGRGHFADNYKLSADFAKKISMTQKTEKGEQARCYFLACEEALKRIAEERKQWEIERAKGVVIRHILTDTIKMKIADSPHKRFAYPNYTKLIYRAIFGKTMKELQEHYGMKGKESLRDYLTAEELKEVEALEMLVSSLINLGMGYDEIKAFVQEHYSSDRLLTA